MKILSLSVIFTFCAISAIRAQIITTIVGDSTGGYNGDNIPATQAGLYSPIAIARDSAGNLYISDRDNNRIRKVSVSGTITTIAGTGVAGFSGDSGLATAAKIYAPYGIAVGKSGNVYFADGHNDRIRKISIDGIITTIAGNGVWGYNGDSIAAISAELNGVCGITVDQSDNIYFADVYNNRIRKIDPSGLITTIAGTGSLGFSGDDSAATLAVLDHPCGITTDVHNNIFFSDAGNVRIRKIDTLGIIRTIAGNGTGGYVGDNGPAIAAKLNFPDGIAVDNAGVVYIADAYNNRIRKVDTSGVITTIAGIGLDGFAGDNGLADSCRLFYPTGVVLDAAGSLYITDFANNRVRYIKNTVSVGIVGSSSGEIKIYPNPSPGFFTINICSPVNEAIGIIITNILSEKIKEISVLIPNKHQNTA